jgi:hypothetical protein
MNANKKLRGFILKAGPGKRSTRKRAKVYGEEVQLILLFQ